MLSEDALKILVPFITTVIGAIIAFIFTRSHYEKKRKDDLADKNIDRQIAIRDARIKEANAYLDKVISTISFSEHVGSIIHDEKSFKDIFARLSYIEENLSNFSSPLIDLANKKKSIDVLKNEELINLNNKLNSVLSHPLERLKIVFSKMRNYYFEGIERSNFVIEIKEDLDFEEMEASFSEAQQIIIEMKIKLDALAQNIEK